MTVQVELEPRAWLAAGVRTAARCPEPVQVTVVPGRGPGPAAQAGTATGKPARAAGGLGPQAGPGITGRMIRVMILRLGPSQGSCQLRPGRPAAHRRGCTGMLGLGAGGPEPDSEWSRLGPDSAARPGPAPRWPVRARGGGPCRLVLGAVTVASRRRTGGRLPVPVRHGRTPSRHGPRD